MAQNVPEELTDEILRGVPCPQCARVRNAWVRERTRNVDEGGVTATQYFYIFECDYCDHEWEIPDDFDFDLKFAISCRNRTFRAVARLVDVGRELGVEPEGIVDADNPETSGFTVHVPAAHVLQALELKTAVVNLTAKEVNSNV